ncbi:MAG: response regulator [Candidatus Methanoperedens sp.]|nr:response regulator [Candidatus Methanoperedens sp.]
MAKDAIGKSIYQLFPDVKGTKVEQFYIEALKTQQPGRFESEYQLGDKKLVFEINAYPTKTGLSVISKDITENKMFEAHLLRAQRMESIGILAGGIAHNLNNMLTPMMMSLHMLKEKFKDEQSQKLLTILEKNSERSADLIKQVLSFSRGVEGERNLLAARHIITEIEKIAKETFPRNIEIRIDIQKDLFTISGDATQLHQVIMNLCVNARDAMPDGGILNIKASNILVDENYARMNTEAKVGSCVVIEISDTGIGIPPKILDKIFEPFFTTKEFGKGTGLGLSTALAIVKSHGGFINVYSEVRKGTTFRVYLPAINPEMQNVEEKQKLELLTGHGELILIAEDEKSVREVTVSTLEKHGYNVLAANDGADAVALYAQNKDKINVVLMDMMMPVMDGEASIRAIHRINPEVKVIVVSGLAEKDKVAKIESTHAQAILPKPYTAERLLKAMHEVLSAK